MGWEFLATGGCRNVSGQLNPNAVNRAGTFEMRACDLLHRNAQMNVYTTTECTNCRHTFLRYASSCPECGQVRPKHHRVNKPMIACLIGSAVAIGMTFTLVVKYKHASSAANPDGQQGSVATR
jgi:hypothetical protein